MADVCVLCQARPPDVEVNAWDDDHVYPVKCKMCGPYRLTLEARGDIESVSEDNRLLLSCWVYEQFIRNRPIPTFVPDYTDASFVKPNQYRASDVIDNLVPRTVSERLERALANLSVLLPRPGQIITMGNHRRLAVFALNGDETRFMVTGLLEQGLIGGNYPTVSLTARGWERVAAMESPRLDSQQVFVAMSFHESLNAAWSEGFLPAISSSGYSPLRVDKARHNDKICNKIVRDIQQSRFLVADVTRHRQGVYFEAGLAMGIGMPVIWTCQRKHMGRCHFDTRQYSHLRWDTPEDLCTNLSDHIAATIGTGRRHGQIDLGHS